MAREVFFTKSALRDLKSLPKRHAALVIAKIETAAQNVRAAGEEMLRGRDGLYRVRQGDYRVVYRKEAGALLVLLVAHRRDVYAKVRRLH